MLMKIKSIFLFSFLSLFFCAHLINGQETISSLEDSIGTYIYTNPEKAIAFSHKHLKISKEANDEKKIILSYSALAVAYEVMSQIDSTLYYYHKRLSLIDEPKDIIDGKYFIARIYDNNYDYNEALLLYNQIIELAKKEGDEEVVTDIKFYIELIKTKVGFSRDGLSEEAFNYLKEVYEEQKQKTGITLSFSRKILIEVYMLKGKYKEAYALIDEGVKEAQAANNVEFLYYMYEFKSRIDFFQKKYKNASLNAKKAFEFAKQLKNEEFINEINFRKAFISFKENNFKKSLVMLQPILKSEIKKSSLQAAEYYELTAKVYKNLDSTRHSVTYYSKYIEEKNKASQEYLSAIQNIHDITLKEEVADVQDSYEIELKEEISEREKQKTTKWIWTGISVALLLLIVTLVLFFKNKSRINQKRFDDLMLKVNAFEANKAENQDKIDDINEKEDVLEGGEIKLPQNIEDKVIEKVDSTLSNVDINENTDSGYVINDKKVEEILVKLKNLEDKMYFLRQDCTLHNMAKKLKTNTSYLSKIINTHLDKTFSAYINELRINYAIIELKNNTRLRSYSVRAIAQELGYKNADAFSKYFREATGISPFVYIKKIQEI